MKHVRVSAASAGCLTERNILEEIVVNHPDGLCLFLADDERLAVPAVAIGGSVPLLPSLKFLLNRPLGIVGLAATLLFRKARQNSEHEFPVRRERLDVLLLKPYIDAERF